MDKKMNPEKINKVISILQQYPFSDEDINTARLFLNNEGISCVTKQPVIQKWEITLGEYIKLTFCNTDFLDIKINEGGVGIEINRKEKVRFFRNELSTVIELIDKLSAI